MTALPKSVQRQLEQADAIQAQLAQPPAATEVISDASQVLATPPEPPAPVAPEPPPKPVDSVDWKNKALTLEGMLRTQGSELKAQNTILLGQVSQLQRTVEGLQQAAAKPVEPPKATPDPKDVEQFGSEMMDMVQRYVSGAVNDLKRFVEERVQRVEGVVQTVGQKADDTREATFWASLEQQVPRYREINASDSWMAWLAEVDELTGVPRQAALKAAQNALDAVRVAKIFKLYEKTLPPAPSSALASQVSPGTGGSAAPPAAAQPAPIVTEKAINDFYQDVRRGKYKGRDDEVARIEAFFHQAAAEGRVVR